MSSMKIYLIYRGGVKPFDIHHPGVLIHSAVLIAESESAARLTHPDGCRYWDPGFNCWMFESGSEDDQGLIEWTRPDDVKIEEIGTAGEGVLPRIVCTNFMRCN